MMKWLFVFLVTLIYLAGNAQNKSENALTIRKVSAKDVKAIMDSSTGPVIINFWASWCGPCTREIPWFDSIIAQRNAPVKLLLVSLDFKSAYPNQLAAFVKKQGYKGEVVFLNDTNSDEYIPLIDPEWTGEIPASIFINNSKQYYHLYNQQLPKERFGIELEKLLN